MAAFSMTGMGVSKLQAATGNEIWLWSGHYQATLVSQYHDHFAALYNGPNSLSNDPEIKTSLTTTLFLSSRLMSSLELYVDPELSGGSGFSNTLGLAGYSNGEIYRVSDPYPVVDRLMA